MAPMDERERFRIVIEEQRLRSASLADRRLVIGFWLGIVFAWIVWGISEVLR